MKAQILTAIIAGSMSLSLQANNFDEDVSDLETEFEMELDAQADFEIDDLMHPTPKRLRRAGKSNIKKGPSHFRKKAMLRKKLRKLQKRTRKMCSMAGLDRAGKIELREKMKTHKVAIKSIKKEMRVARKAYRVAVLEANANASAIEQAAQDLGLAVGVVKASNRSFVGITVNDLFEEANKKKGLKCLNSKMKTQQLRGKLKRMGRKGSKQIM
ncbi:MAG: hypothetical protein AB8E15_09630 [Bdellovibrionales bacterium]